jgi:hypothetical protein
MKKTIITACLALCLLSQGFAQDKGLAVDKGPATNVSGAHRSWTFRSQELGGLVSGQEGHFGQGYTINGVYKGPWFMGIGAGLDFYRYRTVPVFFSLERELTPPGHGGVWFARLDAGVNIPWQSERSWYYPSGASSSGHYLTAPYWDAVFGYKIFVNARHSQALMLSAGYSFKEVQDKRVETNYCPIAAACNTNPDMNTVRYNYNNRRFSLQVGYQF